MIVAGFGCRTGCTLDDALGALSAALEQAKLAFADLNALGAPERKAHEPGLLALAERVGKPLLPLSDQALRAHGPHTLTRSAHAMAHFGVPCVAEAAALAGLDSLGVPRSRLIAPRHAVGGATCALATRDH